MMKALTHNIRQEREDQRDRSAQLFMWCIVVSMHQDDGIGASRLLRACNEMDAFEKKIPDGHPLRQQQERNGRHEGEPQRHLRF